LLDRGSRNNLREPFRFGFSHLKIAAAITLAIVCASTAQAEIVIGVAGPMSGQNAAFGQYMKSGVDAAVTAINQKGGINGEQLTVTALDDQCDGRKAVEVANQLAAADARLVVGHFCSNATAAASKVYADRNVLMITPAASAPKVTDQGNATTLRLVMRDDAQGAAAATRILQDDPAAIIVIIDDGTANSKALSQSFTTIKAPALVVSIKPGEKNLTAVSEKIKSANATAIYFACGGIEAGGIIAAYKADGGFAKAYGSDAILVDTFWERSDLTGEGTLATFPPDPQKSPDAREAIAAMNAASQPPEGPALASYAAVEAFVAAAMANPTADGKTLANWLRKGQPIKTILGPIAFDAKGDITPQHFDWYRWSAATYSRTEGN
jgi:branched-chain amino acid transport system substrate-binding protein